MYDTWLRERKMAIIDLARCSYESVLIKISDVKSIWYLNQHHMLVDANSFSVIFRRMKEIYERSLKGKKLTLNPVKRETIARTINMLAEDRYIKTVTLL